MKSHDFKEELLQYVSVSYDQFNESKAVLKDILNAFHKVCKNNNIQYFLAFGSLLGLVRDELLMPPWDRDIDTIIWFKDKDRLLAALEKDLPKEYDFECKENNSDFPYYQIHLFRKGDNPTYIHVDVFYLLNVSDDVKEQNKTAEEIKDLFLLRRRKKAIIEKGNFHKVIYTIIKIMKLIYRFYPDTLLDAKFNKITQQKDTNTCITFTESALIYPKTIFDTCREVICEGIKVNIPGDADTFLKIIYGDYMTYLPIENRMKEFFDGNDIVKKYSKSK